MLTDKIYQYTPSISVSDWLDRERVLLSVLEGELEIFVIYKHHYSGWTSNMAPRTSGKLLQSKPRGLFTPGLV